MSYIRFCKVYFDVPSKNRNSRKTQKKSKNTHNLHIAVWRFELYLLQFAPVSSFLTSRILEVSSTTFVVHRVCIRIIAERRSLETELGNDKRGVFRDGTIAISI